MVNLSVKTGIFGLFLLIILFILCPTPAYTQAGPRAALRTFDEIFPGFDKNLKNEAFSQEGYKRSFEKHESQSVVPGKGSGIDLFRVVSEKNPSHFIEALMVVPYKGAPLGIHDAYNAVGRIGEIKNYSYFSHGRNMDIHIFEESTRIEGAKNNKPIPDPPPSGTFPASEEMFLHLRDRYFGNIYVRGNLSANQYGLTFNATNFKTIRYFVFPIMRAEKFSAMLYLEPLEEGMLVYGMAAVDIPAFIASRINIASSVEIRLNTFIDWFREGLKKAN